MLLIPAIDLRDGQCVRLYQGKKEKATVFSRDPVAVAKSWEHMGAPMLHLVDLDGAFTGEPQNLEVIKAIVENVQVPTQVGGGIRTLATVEKVLSLGVSRVILGTVAINHPELVREGVEQFGSDKILVGIDSKDGLVAVEGWEATAEKTALELACEMKEAGVKTIIYTDTSRDGTMHGPNLESTVNLARESGLRVIASGGFSSLDDVINLQQLEGVSIVGAILGRAIYTGAIDLREALALVGSR